MPKKRGYSAGFSQFNRQANAGVRDAQRNLHRRQQQEGERAERRERNQSEGVKARYGEGADGGYTDNYFGGEDEPDGKGHGHIRVGEDGSEQIVRESYDFGQPGGSTLIFPSFDNKAL